MINDPMWLAIDWDGDQVVGLGRKDVPAPPLEISWAPRYCG